MGKLFHLYIARELCRKKASQLHHSFTGGEKRGKGEKQQVRKSMGYGVSMPCVGKVLKKKSQKRQNPKTSTSGTSIQGGAENRSDAAYPLGYGIGNADY